MAKERERGMDIWTLIKALMNGLEIETKLVPQKFQPKIYKIVKFIRF